MASSRLYVMATFAMVAISATFADDACPSEAELAPCTCDGEGVNCMGPVTLDQIRRAFRARFKYGGVRSMWIQATRITNVPADIFSNIKVQEAYIEVNNLTSLDLLALSGSSKSLNVLSLFGNGLKNFDFSGLKQFSVLSTLNLGNNKITSVRDVQSQYLHTLILAQNEVSDIAENAFINAPNLNKLELSQNRLKTLGPRSFILKSNFPLIGLVSNQISSVHSTAFEATTPQLIRLSANQLTSLRYEDFGSLASRMAQNGGIIEVYSNPFTCRGCDYSWLVNNKNTMEKLFLGFYCRTGGNMGSLTKENIGCQGRK